jgi:hypothetical protein
MNKSMQKIDSQWLMLTRLIRQTFITNALIKAAYIAYAQNKYSLFHLYWSRLIWNTAYIEVK